MNNEVNSSASEMSNEVAERLKYGKNEILSLWEQRVRKNIEAAQNEPHPILIDTLPLLLDQLVDALSTKKENRSIASQGATACQEHGGERARLTQYNIDAVIQEYQILRDTIFEVLLKKGKLSEREKNIIQMSVDDIMKQSATAFALVQSTIREQFFMTLSHDLRGPLTAALANAEMISKNQECPKMFADLASKVIKNIHRIDKMITDLLDANRIRGGERLPLHISECDLSSIVIEVTNELSNIHGSKFVIRQSEQVRGFWDGNALRRAFENLCTNAIKYGDNSLPITIHISNMSGRTTIAVHNYGIPIPAEEQETLFKAYRRARSVENSRTKGWGLGLALVRGVAEAHGGSVMLDSAPDRGTTFTIDLPTDTRPFISRAKQPFAA